DAITAGPALLRQGGAILALAAAKRAVADTRANRLAPGWSPTRYLPVFNPLMLDGVALAASIIAIYRLRRARIESLLQRTGAADIAPAVLVLAAVALLMTVGLSFEVDRAVSRLADVAWPRWQLRQMAWTMLWTLASVAYLALHARIEPAARGRSSW